MQKFTAMKKVLIVEDDPNIINLLSIHLEDLNCNIHIANNGIDGEEKALNEAFDLIILDVMLPGKDGITIAQKLRAFEIHSPIMMLTAKTEEVDKVLGLESGADDYLTKPFGVREFIARVKAIFRRQEQNSKSRPGNNLTKLSIGNLQIDVEKRRVKRHEDRIDLTPKEFDLLVLLASNPGKSFSRNQLLSEIWGYEFSGYEHTVNSHINRLRTKLEPDINNPEFILTTWGIGYRFNDEI